MIYITRIMWKCWYALLCLCVVIDTDIVSGTLPDIATLCPYSDFCHSKATKIHEPDEKNTVIPCCEMCSCEPDCQHFGNCCPDKKLTPNVDVIHPCINIDIYFNDPRGFSASVVNNFYYRVVDECPNAILDIVYPRCTNIIDLEDFIFVSDPSNQRVYKNKHCALCHGVANYKEWPLLTYCPHDTTGRNIEEWHSYIKENCSIIPVPPDQNAGSLVRCHKSEIMVFEKISRCNDTRKWETYDKDIDLACNMENVYTNNMYTHETIDAMSNDKRAYYENVYCKLCNKRHDEIWPDLCENNLPLFQIRGITRLSVFINFNTQAVEDKSISQRCQMSQIWNPFNESCMNVTCPSATYLHKGTCENMYKRTYGYTYALLFRILSNNSVYNTDFVRRFHQTMTDMIGNTECKKCGTTLRVDYNSIYYLEYLVNTRDSCTEDFILSKIKNFTENSPLSLQLGSASNITMVCALDGYDNLKLTIPLPSINRLYCPFHIYVTWEMIDKCPRIPISSLESNDSTYQITTERRGTLCVNEYFKIMESLHNSQMTEHAHVHIILNIVIILVCVFICYGTM